MARAATRWTVGLPLAICLAMTGCAAPTLGSEPTLVREAAAPAPARPPTGATPQANLTSCGGAHAQFYLPAEWVAPRIPPGFGLLDTTPGLAVLRFELAACRKLAVDGRDAGAASWMRLRVPVVAPEHLRPPPARGSEFVLELRTDSPPLLEWFTDVSGGTFGNASSSRALESLALGYSRLEAATVADGRLVYDLRGLVRSNTSGAIQEARWFYDTGQGVAYSDVRFVGATSTSLAPASLYLGESSRARGFSHGLTFVPALAQRADADALLLEGRWGVSSR